MGQQDWDIDSVYTHQVPLALFPPSAPVYNYSSFVVLIIIILFNYSSFVVLIIIILFLVIISFVY